MAQSLTQTNNQDWLFFQDRKRNLNFVRIFGLQIISIYMIPPSARVRILRWISNKILLKSLVIISIVLTTSPVVAQRVRVIADVELAGQGLVNQTITLGNNTNTESITGMSGVSLGVNVGLPLRFETSLTGGSLFKLGFNSTYSSSYGGSTSSTSFALPKLSLELARSFIWNEQKGFSGINLAVGIERYWPTTFSTSEDSNDLKITYDPAIGQYYRIKMVFREGKRIQLEPNITFRNANLTASHFRQTGSSNALDPSMSNLQIQNLSIGLVLLLGFSKK